MQFNTGFGSHALKRWLVLGVFTGFAIGCAAQPLEGAVAAPGYSGLAITPSAAPLPLGAMTSAFDTANPGAAYAKGYNYLVSMGLLSGLEVTARLAANNNNCNLYGIGSSCPGGSFRDLSASAKAGWELAVGRDTWLAASAGVTDYGGAATQFRSYYGVAGVRQSIWAMNLGWAKAVNITAPLSGLFGSLSLQLWDPLQLYVEKVGVRNWFGVRLESHAGDASRARYYVAANRSLQDDAFTPKQWWSVGVKIPLGSVERSRQADVQALKSHLQGSQSLVSQGQDQAYKQEHPHKPDHTVSTSEQKTQQITAQQSKPMIGAVTKQQFVGEGSSSKPFPGEMSSAALGVNARENQREKIATNPLKNGPTEPEVMRRKHWSDLAVKVADEMAKAGFESIDIGYDERGPVLRLQTYSYNWNQLDALGVAMGTLSEHAHDWPNTRLQLRRQGIPIYLAVGRPACMHRWLSQYEFDCGQPDKVELWAAQNAALPDLDAVQWLVHDMRSSTGRTKMFITPAIDSRVGTEYGAFDSTWGLNLTWQTPLWQGASSDVAYVRALGHSSDYANGGVFSDFRIDNMLHRVMVHQAVDLSQGFSAKVAYGRLAQVLQGHHGELRWESPEGLHRFSHERSHFAHRFVNFSKDFYMSTYRRYWPDWDVALELKSGQFWHGDKGHMLISRHWFGDTNISIFVRRSRFAVGAPALFSPYGSVPVLSAGIEVSFPLTPRREVQTDWVQPRGDDRFSYGLQSVIKAANSTNYTSPYFGTFSPVPLGLDGGVYNFDRGSQAYLMTHLGRLRQAWRSFRAYHNPKTDRASVDSSSRASNSNVKSSKSENVQEFLVKPGIASTE